MLLSRIITEALRVGMDSCKSGIDVENEYKVLQHFFLSDKETRKMFIKELTFEDCWEIAQKLDVSALAKLIVIKEDGE